MEELIDGNTLDRIAVRYRPDERRAVLLAIRVYRELLLSHDPNYEDLEGLQIKVQVTMDLEDSLEAGSVATPDADAHIREYFLPSLISAAELAHPNIRDYACELLRTTPDELFTCAATAMTMLREEFPDILLATDEFPGSGGALTTV